MAGLELLEDDRGFLHNFLPIGRGTDVKENTHHHHVVSSQFLPLSLMHYTLHGRHPAERLPWIHNSNYGCTAIQDWTPSCQNLNKRLCVQQQLQIDHIGAERDICLRCSSRGCQRQLCKQTPVPTKSRGCLARRWCRGHWGHSQCKRLAARLLGFPSSALVIPMWTGEGATNVVSGISIKPKPSHGSCWGSRSSISGVVDQNHCLHKTKPIPAKLISQVLCPL